MTRCDKRFNSRLTVLNCHSALTFRRHIDCNSIETTCPMCPHFFVVLFDAKFPPIVFISLGWSLQCVMLSNLTIDVFDKDVHRIVHFI